MDRHPFWKYTAYRGKGSYDEVYGERSYRTIFHHDRAEVTYSPFFRRTAFREYHIAPPGYDNRTRLLHSIEVATIASGMARRLRLDQDLAEAIAMGHDIAQPPCGYPAEKVLDTWLNGQGGFDHGLLAAQLLEWHSLKAMHDKRFDRLSTKPCYKTLDLADGKMVTSISAEVLDGILKHTPPKDNHYGNPALTVEGQLVRIADNLSYLSQEIEEGLRLDDSYKSILTEFGGQPVLRNSRTNEQKTREELLAPQPGCPQDPEFLYIMFDTRLGPRLVAMIKRIESYNKAKLKMSSVQWKKTDMCKQGRIPVLEYDPILKFIIDFLWDEFIGKVINESPQVRARIIDNRDKIELALKILNDNDPSDLKESLEFKAREAEVNHYYSWLSGDELRRRVVANYVALLTNQQINELVKSRP